MPQQRNLIRRHQRKIDPIAQQHHHLLRFRYRSVLQWAVAAMVQLPKMAESVIPVKAIVYFQETGEMKVTSISRSLKKATGRLSKDLFEKYKMQKVNLSIMYADIPDLAEAVCSKI